MSDDDTHLVFVQPEDPTVSHETEPLSSPLITFQFVCSCGYVAHELTGPTIELTRTYIYSYLAPMYDVPCPACHTPESFVARIFLAAERG